MDDAEKIKDTVLDRKARALTDLFNATQEVAFLQETDGTIVTANDHTGRFLRHTTGRHRRKVNP